MKETIALAYTLITGASGGIGKELAYIFAQEEHDLILVARDESKLDDIAKEIEQELHVDVQTVSMDLSTMDAPSKLHETTLSKGWDVDILVNNAGFGRYTCFLDADIKRLNQMMALNMHTVADLMYYYGNDMREHGEGKILNIASIASITSGPYMAMYYATKAFVRSLGQAVNYENENYGVSVTTVCPGPVDTGFGKAAAMHGKNWLTMVKPSSPQKVARFAYTKLMQEKSVVYPGALAKAAAVLGHLAPGNISTAFAAWVNGGQPGHGESASCPSPACPFKKAMAALGKAENAAAKQIKSMIGQTQN